MKRKSILLFLCCALSTSAFAHGIGAVPVVRDARWTAVQIGVWPFLLFDDGAKVMGLNLNLILTCQRRAVGGFSLAPFNSCGDDVGGLSLVKQFNSFLNVSESFWPMSTIPKAT